MNSIKPADLHCNREGSDIPSVASEVILGIGKRENNERASGPSKEEICYPNSLLSLTLLNQVNGLVSSTTRITWQSNSIQILLK